jgi:hypothetical protein
MPGTITTVAGSGVRGWSGDGGPATDAAIGHPRGIAVERDGGYLFAEPFNGTVRQVSPDGTITTVAGNDVAGSGGDGGPATGARLDDVHGVAVMPDGGFVIADTNNNRIRRVWPDGTITTVVGTGTYGFAGDGGPATAAEIAAPRGIASLPDGTLLIPDTENDRIRLVRLDGTISTVAGTGNEGFSGDGGPATAADLNLPFGVAPMPGGGFLIADAANHRVRRVWPDGTITTVAGTGVAGYGGDGGDAVDAEMTPPINLAPMPDGGFVFADTDNHRVRRVWPDRTITTIAGTGAPGFSGDGGPAVDAELQQPKAVAVTRTGAILVGDSANDRVRLVEPPAMKPPRIVVARFARTGQFVRASFRVCDSARAPLVAELRQSRVGSETVLSRRRLASTGGGCRQYTLAGRVPVGKGPVAERLQVRSSAGLLSNVERSSI